MRKVLRMIDESEERPPAYFLYNDQVNLISKKAGEVKKASSGNNNT